MKSPDQLPPVKWLKDVVRHDYDAAEAYLSLLLNDADATWLVARLREHQVVRRRANDILRACHREPLAWDDPTLRDDIDKVAAEKPLSPVLAVSFAVGADIADGYHRVSLAYHLHPETPVPLKIAGIPHRR